MNHDKFLIQQNLERESNLRFGEAWSFCSRLITNFGNAAGENDLKFV